MIKPGGLFVCLVWIVGGVYSNAHADTKIDLSHRSASGDYFSCFLNEKDYLNCIKSAKTHENINFSKWDVKFQKIASGRHFYMLIDPLNSLLDKDGYFSIGRLYATSPVGFPLSWKDDPRFFDLQQPTQQSMAFGDRFSCFLNRGGKVFCTGDSPYGHVGPKTFWSVPDDLGEAIAIEAGPEDICAIKKDYTAQCWGKNKYGQGNVPPGLTEVEEIALGYGHVCARRTPGDLVCWGRNFFKALEVPSSVINLRKIVANGVHTCGLLGDGSVSCWGRNQDGESISSENQGSWEDVTAGPLHTCVKNKSGEIKCWGDGFSPKARISDKFHSVKELGLGDNEWCVLDASNLLECNVLLLEDQLRHPTPQDLGGIKQLEVGMDEACALLENGSVSCWAVNHHIEDPLITQIPPGLMNITAIAMGGYHVCALDTQGKVTCWGNNESGEINVPNSLKKIRSISAGGQHTCALDVNGKVVCWGRNHWGQASVPSWATKGVRSISAIRWASCAITEPKGALKCWGEEIINKINDDFKGKKDLLLVDGGGDHVCALDKEGKVLCGGGNQLGQTKVPNNLQNIIKIIVGGARSCAVEKDQKLTCWGIE